MVETGIAHVKDCPLCKAKGYICELCNKDSDILFPFDLHKVAEVCPTPARGRAFGRIASAARHTHTHTPTKAHPACVVSPYPLFPRTVRPVPRRVPPQVLHQGARAVDARFAIVPARAPLFSRHLPRSTSRRSSGAQNVNAGPSGRRVLTNRPWLPRPTPTPTRAKRRPPRPPHDTIHSIRRSFISFA